MMLCVKLSTFISANQRTISRGKKNKGNKSIIRSRNKDLLTINFFKLSVNGCLRIPNSFSPFEMMFIIVEYNQGCK